MPPKKGCFRKIVFIYFTVLLLLVVFGAGVLVGRLIVPGAQDYVGEVINQEKGRPEDIDFSLFWKVWEMVHKKFPSEINDSQLFYGSIKGMVAGLDDPYSVFLDPEETKFFESEMDGAFEGIGVELGIRDGALTVIAPLEGYPAEKAGIKAGDKILEIDGISTQELTLDEAAEMIRGEKGTHVRLVVLHKDSRETEELEIVREKIVVQSVKWEVKEEDLAYIKIRSFDEGTRYEFDKVAQEVVRQGLKGVILDLRGNPGGYLESAVRATAEFVDSGRVVVIESYPDPNENIEHKSRGSPYLKDLPVVVLVDEGSASASEIMAGALRDLRGTRLVGERTFGKGYIQELESFDDGSSLRITIAKWVTPHGTEIGKEGIVPDFEVSISDEEVAQEKDSQLEKAIEVLRREIEAGR